MKTIAVLMSTYNGEKYLKEQINSILSQKCECTIDLIIRDDGSIDNTTQILDSYGDKLRWYSGENCGVGLSFLKLVQDNIGYDYYAFSDQDDYWYSDKLQRGIDTIKNVDNYALYCSNAEMCDESLKPLGRNVHRSMEYYNMERAFVGFSSAQGCTCVFNKKLAEIIQINKLPQNFILHDSYLTCLCFALGGFFFADEYASMKYRMHSSNVGGMNTKAQSGIIGIIKSRTKYIIKKPHRSISLQVEEIFENNFELVVDEAKIFINNVLDAKHSYRRILKLATNQRLKEESFNLDVANRLKLLLNNF